MRVVVRLSAVLGVIALIVGSMIGSGRVSAATGGATAAGATSSQRHITSMGSTDVRTLSMQRSARQSASTSRHLQKPNGIANRRAAAAAVPVPNPPVTAAQDRTGGAKSFVGVTVLSQAEASNGNQYTLEPPDQGLCANNGIMIETVNNGLQIYTEFGQALTTVIAMNAFFHLPPEINFAYNPPTFGPFLSDPRCYYDTQTGRWFLTELQIDINPYSGRFGYRSSELLAVSQTSDPTGGWGLFMIDSTDDGSHGTQSFANCPCFGDQPRIGADANGFYISTDIYPIHGLFNSDGGELYAISKYGLASAAVGGPPPTLVDIHVGGVMVDGYPANALQPAESPAGGFYAADTEYFLNNPDYNGFATSGGQGETAVEIWALHGTGTLNSSSPTVALTTAELNTEAYAPPVAAVQKAGPTPYGSSLGASEATISVNDDRMQQVEYVNGVLYSSLNTGVGANGSADRSGIAWFAITPEGNSGDVVGQGYVAAGKGTSLLYPSIGLTAAGSGVMTFSISGPTRYPSGAYMRFNGTPTGPIIVNGQGAAPEDGFTCYAQAGFGPSCRWGDYTAASSDGAGHIVFANEMIPNSARATDSNWGTFVSVLRVP